MINMKAIIVLNAVIEINVSTCLVMAIFECRSKRISIVFNTPLI